jgi:hypothetical protein
MNMITSLLLARTGAADILQNGSQTASAVALTWSKQWATIFQSELYYTIVALAGGFAAGALLFFMLTFFRKMMDQEDYSGALSSFLMAMIVIMLLSNNAYVLSRGTIAIRGVIHTVSQRVLTQTLLEVSLQEAIQASIDKGSVSTEIGALLSQCQGVVGQTQVDCLKAANEQAKGIIQDYQSSHPFSSTLDSLKDSILSKVPGGEAAGTISSIIGAGLSSAQNGGALDGDAGATIRDGMVGALAQSLVQSVLLAFQWAFANILEIAMLLTGLIGPIAVAGALMFDGKSLWSWLTGFFAIGMAQVCYNIIVGVAAVVVVNADITDTLGFLIVISLLAPALALGIASGGGLVVFNLISGGLTGGLLTLAQAVPAVPRITRATAGGK